MTEIIALCGCVLMLMFFPLQYTNEQINYHNLLNATNRVEDSAEVAKQDGCFTAENQNALRADLAKQFDVPPEEIKVTATGTTVYRGDTYAESGIIYYEVDVPIKHYLAVNKLWGVSDEDNQFEYPITGRVASEKLRPL